VELLYLVGFITKKLVSGIHFIVTIDIAAAVFSFEFRMHKIAIKDLGSGAHGAQNGINPTGGRHLK
jgi:hypothetical protein